MMITPPPPCPFWCAGDHLDEDPEMTRDGFHHESTPVMLDCCPEGDLAQIGFRLVQYMHEGRPAHEPHVEVLGDGRHLGEIETGASEVVRHILATLERAAVLSSHANRT